MGRTCRACQHPERAALDAALARGESNRAVAGRFSLTRSGVGRHRAHIGEAISAARAERRAEAVSIAADLARSRQVPREVLDGPAADARLRLTAARDLGAAAEREARVTGQVAPERVEVAGWWGLPDPAERDQLAAVAADPDALAAAQDAAIGALGGGPPPPAPEQNGGEPR
jgi:hypothetical protein